MLDQDSCARPVIVTLPAQLTAANAEQAAGQISAAFTPGVSVVIADLTSTVCRDRAAIRHLLKAHRTAAVRGRQVRFAIRPGDPLRQITDFAGIHPLLAVYPTLQHAIASRSPWPTGSRTRLRPHQYPDADRERQLAVAGRQPPAARQLRKE